MKSKAIKELSQLDEKSFLNSISIGLNYIFNNAKLLFSDAEILHKSNRQRGNSVLQALANEEVAKILILGNYIFDAQSHFNRQNLASPPLTILTSTLYMWSKPLLKLINCFVDFRGEFVMFRIGSVVIKD